MPFLNAALDPRRTESLLCGYVREAVDHGFLTGEEPFLSDLEWR
jgi:hypothetical protein